MSLTHPDLAHRALDLERERLLAPAAAKPTGHAPRPGSGFRPLAAAACRGLGAALVRLGVRLQAFSPQEAAPGRGF